MEKSIDAGWDLVKVLHTLDNSVQASAPAQGGGGLEGPKADLDLTTASPLGCISAVGQQRSKLQVTEGGM